MLKEHVGCPPTSGDKALKSLREKMERGLYPGLRLEKDGREWMYAYRPVVQEALPASDDWEDEW